MIGKASEGTSHKGGKPMRGRIQSNAGSSDISGFISQKPISDGPSQSALDDEEFIRNIWLDYEYEVN